MKVTVELSENEIGEILQMTGRTKKGPAVRQMVVDALMLGRRRAATRRIVAGDWQFEMPAWSETRRREREPVWPR